MDKSIDDKLLDLLHYALLTSKLRVSLNLRLADYASQIVGYRSTRTVRSEDKVNIILNGHWCVMDSYERRKINQFSVPSIVAQTPEMDYNEFTNTVGAYLITVKLDEKGKFKKTTR